MKSIVFLLFMFLISCSALEGEQKTNVNDIIKSQKIVRMSKPEILSRGEKFGLMLMDSIQIRRTFLEIDCANKALNTSALDTLFGNYMLTVKVGFDTKVFETSTEKELLEAYQYNHASNIESQHAVQFLTDHTILFTYPASLDSLQKINCPMPDSLSLGMWSIKIPVKTVLNELD